MADYFSTPTPLIITEIDTNSLLRSGTVLNLPKDYLPVLSFEVFSPSFVLGQGVIYTPIRTRISIEVFDVNVVHTSDSISSQERIDVVRDTTLLDNGISSASQLADINSKNILEVFKELSKVNYDVGEVSAGNSKVWSENVIQNIGDTFIIKSIMRAQHYSYSEFATAQERGFVNLTRGNNNALTPNFRSIRQ